MPLALVFGLAAGLASAVVFASATTGPAVMRLLLFFLTPLPIYLAGLVHGWRAALLGVASGTLLIALLTRPEAGLMFAVCEGLPAAALVYLATLYRSSGPIPSPAGVEWYPVGRIVLWAAVIGAVLAVISLLKIGGDRDAIVASLKTIIATFVKKEVSASGTPVPLDDKTLESLAETTLALLPAFSAAMWTAGHLLNLWLAGRVASASGHLARPWPDIAGFSLPPKLPIALAAAALASFVDGNLGFVASAYAGALTFAYALLGIAIIHYVTRGFPWRPFALSTLYASFVILNVVPLVGAALLGLADALKPLRRRPPGVGGQPPPAPPTSIV